MKNLASRYKALLALLPFLALLLIVTGVVPLADGIPFAPVAYTLTVMCIAFLTGDIADSWLFVRAVVKYLASLDLADDTIEAELDSLDDIINPPVQVGNLPQG